MLLLGQGSYALASISVRDARGDELLPRSVLQLGPDDAFPWLSTSPSGWTAPPPPPHPIFGCTIRARMYPGSDTCILSCTDHPDRTIFGSCTDVLPSGARRRLAAATSVTSPGRNPHRPADDHADRPTARRLLKAGGSASFSDPHPGYDTSGGRWATYGSDRWGKAASSVRRRTPVFAGTAAGVHFTGGVSSAPYYYGRRSVLRNTYLVVLTSSYFHHHYGYHDCFYAAAGPVHDESTFDRFACKQATSYRTPDDLDRYELTEALALPPIPRSGRWRQDPNPQWPLELTVHELLLYPPHATEGRAPPALLGFSTNDVSRLSQASQFCRFLLVSSLCSYLLCCVFLPLCFERPSYVSKERRKRCAPSLASKPGSTMV